MVGRGATVILQITLPENATTGYRWAIDSYDEDLVKALANQPRYPAQAIGSGGEVAFTFEAKKIGSGEIVLKHFRHWEGDASINKRFRVVIRVQP